MQGTVEKFYLTTLIGLILHHVKNYSAILDK